MGTIEMLKFWFIKEVMPLLILVAIAAALAAAIVVWACFESVCVWFKSKFCKKSNAVNDASAT
jgi:peptidoglycan/LPS O-acetylase OafA/YrhL